MSKTTIAGIFLMLSFLAVSILVYFGKTSFSDATPVLLGVFSMVGGLGLLKAQDNNPK